MSNEIYIAYHFTITPLEPAREILVAELGMNGFESFVETDQGFTAYIQKKEWSQTILNEVHILKSDEFDFKYKVEDIVPTNWNSEWKLIIAHSLYHEYTLCFESVSQLPVNLHSDTNLCNICKHTI